MVLLTEAVPRLATLLHGDAVNPEVITQLLLSISQSNPDALLLIIPKLERYLETEPQPAHTWLLAAVGHLSKTHPDIAKETIPIAAELVDVEPTVLRANAAGVLADLADEYPTEIDPNCTNGLHTGETSRGDYGMPITGRKPISGNDGIPDSASSIVRI